MASALDIQKAKSAYKYFYSDHVKVLKSEGHTTDVGSLGPAVSAAFKALTETEKQRYKALEQRDRARYTAECAARDEEIAAAQAAARESNSTTDASGPRSTRAAAVPAKAARKATAEEDMTPEQLARRQAQKEQRAKDKAERLAKEAEVSKQRAAVDAAHKAKAQKRLRYLLAQSDIFKTHFGVGQDAEEEAESSSKGKGKASSGGGSSSSRSKRAGAVTPVDEAAAAEEELEESAAPTFLTKQPASLQGQLRNYQLEGLNWMINLQAQGINGVLADEMGLGKTLQSIAVLSYMADYKDVRGPHLVLLPKSTLGNWGNEFRTFCPSLRVLRLHGDKAERETLVQEKLQPGVPQEERCWDVCLTTYEVAKVELKSLAKIGWRYLIIDEAHKLKNENSLVSSTVRHFKADHRLLLTGTPLQNNLHELWALLNILLPDVFADADQFNAFFNLDTDDADAKKTMLSQLHKILRPFMLRRLKSDAAKELPPKVETILFTGLAPKQRTLYKDLLMRNMDTVNSNGANLQRSAMLNIVMQLRKCCNHPYLFPGVEDRNQDPLGEHLVNSCGKLKLLDKLLKKLKEQGHRVLIFSQMTRMLDIMEDLMVMREHEYCRIDGDTSYDQRDDLIDEYNAPNSSKFCFLLSTRAGGLGINLQTADTVILYDSDWNPQADLQAQDRAHRIGQRRPVRVFRLVTENTVEEKVVERAQQKLKLDAMVVQQGRLQEKANLGKDDLMEALRFGADAVFRTQEGAEVTDEDVDAILARGEAKTAELNEKLKKMEKGDLLDFRLDGGMAVQTFEGTDFSDKANRTIEPMYIDTGKRNRKPIDTQLAAAIAASIGAANGAGTKKKVPRLPSPLGLPPMQDWQFYNKARISELQQAAVDKLTAMREEGVDIPNDAAALEAALFSPEDAAERRMLLSQGFPDWSHRHTMRLYVDACAEHGRDAVKEVAAAVGKSEAAVRAYTRAFWQLGPLHMDPAEWDRWSSRIEKGEKKIGEQARLERALAVFVARWEDPWRQLEFKHAKPLGSQFTAEEDRLMLCYTAEYGWGEWEKVTEALLRTPRLAFDYYLRSQPDWAVGRRCEHLVRVAEKDLLEGEAKKRAEAVKWSANSEKRAAKEEATRTEIAERDIKLQETDAQLREMEDRLADAERQKTVLEKLLKAIETGVLPDVIIPPPKTLAVTANSVTAAEGESLDKTIKKRKSSAAAADGVDGSSSKANGHAPAAVPAASSSGTADNNDSDNEEATEPSSKKRRMSLSILPPERLAELARLISAKTDLAYSKTTLVNTFIGKYPAYPKSLIVSSLKTIAVHESRPAAEHSTSSRRKWYLTEEYKHLLDAPQHTGQLPCEVEHAQKQQMSSTAESAAAAAASDAPTKKKAKTGDEKSSKSSTVKASSSSSNSGGSKSATKAPASASKKRPAPGSPGSKSSSAEGATAASAKKARKDSSSSGSSSAVTPLSKVGKGKSSGKASSSKQPASPSKAAGATKASSKRGAMTGQFLHAKEHRTAARRQLEAAAAAAMRSKDTVDRDAIDAQLALLWSQVPEKEQAQYEQRAAAIRAERAQARADKKAADKAAKAADGSSGAAAVGSAAGAAAAAAAATGDSTDDNQ